MNQVGGSFMKNPPMYSWSFSTMGGKLFRGILSSIQMDIFQVHAKYEQPQSSPHQVCGIFIILHSS